MTALLVAVAVLVLIWVVALVASRVRRLDRLHVRTDAARAALEAALERRAAAALAVVAAVEMAAAVETAAAFEMGTALEVAGAARADGLRAAVAGTRLTGDRDREAVENVLGRELAAVPRIGLPDAVLEELVDAEQLLILARRVHNDAVRDTRELRSRRLVRRLHLAGTAPMPEYFEIADAPDVTMAASARPPVAPPA